MRHIDPKDSSVFQEYARLAAEKGWIVQAALEPDIADQIRKEVNAVATMLPKTNAVLDMLIPVAETGGDNTELQHALDALRASVMDPLLAKGFDDQGGEARSLYHSARSMLHAPEGQGTMWLNGLVAFRELLTKHYGQTVKKSPELSGPDEVETGPMPPERIPAADDGQAADDPMTGYTAKVRASIKKMWNELSDEQKLELWRRPEGVTNLTREQTATGFVIPQIVDYFSSGDNYKKLVDAWQKRSGQPDPEWLNPDAETLEKRRQRQQPGAPDSSQWYTDPLVGQVQRALAGLGADVEIDNTWGPITNAGWNAVVSRYGLDKRYRIKLMPKIFPGDQSAPSRKEMEFMVQNGSALAVIEQPGQKQSPQVAPPGKTTEVETGPMPPEHIPAGLPADDGLQETIAAVTNDLVALANDLDSMGLAGAAKAVDTQLKLYREAADKLYDITGETGEQLIGKAHPGGGPTMAPAQNEGGKVETIVEEQKKALQVVQKQPTGKQAFVANQLVALANRLDSEGKTEAAMLVDKTLDELRRASRHPFVGNLRKEGELDAVELAVDLSKVAEALNVIAGEVQDQTFASPGSPRIHWGRKNYGAEFDEFCEDARVFFEQAAKAAPQYVSTPKWTNAIAKRVTSLVPALQSIKAYYRTNYTSHRVLGEWVYDSDTALKTIMGISKKLTQAEGPKMEAAKTGKPGKASHGPASRSLQHTVNKIVSSIEAAYNGGATDRNLLDATFKSIDIPGVTTSGTRGLRKALEVLKRAKRMQGKVYDDVAAQDYNDWLFNKILTPMKRGLKIAGLSGKENLVKTAKAQPPPEFGGGKAPATRRGRGRRRPSVNVRQDIMALQGLMERLGYDLGDAGVDGKWGPKTAAGWVRLSKEIAAMNGPTLAPATPAKSKGPPTNAVALAGKAAAYLINVKGEAGKAITLAPGVKVQESALASPQAFITALSRIPASGVRFVGPRDIFSKENLSKASSLLTKYKTALQQPGSPEAWTVWTKGGGQSALKRRFQMVNSLLAQLPRAGAKVPPMGYGYEGGKTPFGTLEGPGKPGTQNLGAPGSRVSPGGRPGYNALFDPRSIIIEASKLLPEDLLDAMANTKQFIWYATSVWQKGRRMNAQKKDRRAVALAYVTFLRDRLGKLRGRMSQIGERRLGAEAQKIKDRIMLAVSYMSTLEDDLRHGSL